MKKVLLSLVAVMFVLTSCGPDVVKFNDSIIKEQAALEAPVMEYSNKLGQAMATNSQADIKPLGDSLLARIDKSIEVIKGLSTPSGGEKFKEAAVDYFESAKGLVTIGEKSSSLGTEPTQEQITAFTTEFTDLVKKMTEKENAFLAAQKEFAKEKNMQLK